MYFCNDVGKLKIIFFTTEAFMLDLLEQIRIQKIDISNFPIIFYSNDFKSDLSTYLGWNYLNKMQLKLNEQIEK